MVFRSTRYISLSQNGRDLTARNQEGYFVPCKKYPFHLLFAFRFIFCFYLSSIMPIKLESASRDSATTYNPNRGFDRHFLIFFSMFALILVALATARRIRVRKSLNRFGRKLRSLIPGYSHHHRRQARRRADAAAEAAKQPSTVQDPPEVDGLELDDLLFCNLDDDTPKLPNGAGPDPGPQVNN
jgi:hypothetical protein